MTQASSRPSFAAALLRLFSGPIIWAAHFLLVYGANGIACARPPPAREWFGLSPLAWSIVAASLAAIAAIAVIHAPAWRACLRSAGIDFTRATAAGLGFFSVVAIIWETIPVFLVPQCG